MKKSGAAGSRTRVRPKGPPTVYTLSPGISSRLLVMPRDRAPVAKASIGILCRSEAKRQRSCFLPDAPLHSRENSPIKPAMRDARSRPPPAARARPNQLIA